MNEFLGNAGPAGRGAGPCSERMEYQLLNRGMDGSLRTADRPGLAWGLRAWVARLSLLLVAVSAAGSDGLGDLNEPVPMWSTNYPDASRLLEQVVAAIPDTSMQIRATITAKTRTGKVGRRVYAEVLMHSDAGLYSAMYTLRDALGGSLEQLAVSREPERAPLYQYRRGEPLPDPR